MRKNINNEDIKKYNYQPKSSSSSNSDKRGRIRDYDRYNRYYRHRPSSADRYYHSRRKRDTFNEKSRRSPQAFNFKKSKPDNKVSNNRSKIYREKRSENTTANTNNSNNLVNNAISSTIIDNNNQKIVTPRNCETNILNINNNNDDKEVETIDLNDIDNFAQYNSDEEEILNENEDSGSSSEMIEISESAIQDSSSNLQ